MDCKYSEARHGERGAVSIKAVIIVFALLISAFTLIKVVPVYVEQQEVTHDTDELARKASLGLTAYSPDKIDKEIQSLIQEYGLPDGSIVMGARDGNHAEISVKYERKIDFIVATYTWNVDYTSQGNGI